jgi:RNA polymerase sigma factor (sigma-70 family)
VIDEAASPGPAGFDRVYRAERSAVQRHLTYLTGDRSLAEDLTQEAFGRLYEIGAEDRAALRNPRAWLLRVASNLAYNHFRGETRRTAREIRAGIAATADTEDILDVRLALQELDPRDRAVLMLRHSGFSYAEIADAVGLAAGSVGTTLARAQRRFREVYSGSKPGPDQGSDRDVL